MIILSILILLGSIFQGVAMFRSGSMYDFGIGYWGPMARDGVWHEALAKSLLNSVPPINPGFSGEKLSNYHYFYDLFVSVISRFGIPINLLIYKIFPILFSLLLGIGTYKLSMILFKDKKVSLVSVFFAYFASSFGWIISLIRKEEIGGESSFWANQPVSMNLNPPYAISLVIIIFTILLINSYLSKPKIIKGILIIIMSGSLIGFKVYGGVVLLVGILILSLKRLIYNRDYKLTLVAALSGILSLLILIPQSKLSLGLIEVKPFWLIDTMIDAGDRVGIPNFTARRFAYLAENKWLHLFIIQTISFAIFFVGNLGTRLIGFLGFQRKQIKNDLFILIYAIMITSFLPPLIFIQKGNPWNIIQFFYYFLFFAGIFAANGIRKLPAFLAVLVLVITPISSAATFRGWLYKYPPAFLPKTEYEALNFLTTQKDGVILKHPFDKELRGKFKDPYPIVSYADSTYVSAYSGKQVFIEDLEQQIILNTSYKVRVEEADRFFIEKYLSWSAKFLMDNNISYVYVPKVYQLPMAEGEYPMTKIFENDGVNIYSVNR